MCAYRLSQPGGCGRGRQLPSSCRRSTTSQWRKSRCAGCMAEMRAMSLPSMSMPNVPFSVECQPGRACSRVTQHCVSPTRRPPADFALASLLRGPLIALNLAARPAVRAVTVWMPPLAEEGVRSVLYAAIRAKTSHLITAVWSQMTIPVAVTHAFGHPVCRRRSCPVKDAPVFHLPVTRASSASMCRGITRMSEGGLHGN